MSSSPNEQQVQEPEIKVEDKQKNLESGPCEGWFDTFCPSSSDDDCSDPEKLNKRKVRKQKTKK